VSGVVVLFGGRVDVGVGGLVGVALAKRIAEFDAVVVVDQVSEPQGGIVDGVLRMRLAELGRSHSKVFILADSRFSIGEYTNVRLKPNIHEARRALRAESEDPFDLASRLGRRCSCDVFLTCGADGIIVANLDGTSKKVSGVKVAGPVDPTGAGDSASAGIALAAASGATNLQAAAIGNLVASITVEQLRTTGTASRERVLKRFGEIASAPR
jgi:bifunctional ADP-heptose synthase (sugar kinase/adenylyltransferase)